MRGPQFYRQDYRSRRSTTQEAVCKVSYIIGLSKFARDYHTVSFLPAERSMLVISGSFTSTEEAESTESHLDETCQLAS